MAFFLEANLTPNQVHRDMVAEFPVPESAFGAVVVPQADDELRV
jgi:hypothetical protein